MSRLPTPGGDDGQWGDILNGFLLTAHTSDGSLKTVGLSQGGTGATSASQARTNLELGDSATRNVGTTSGTVAAGDDSRITDAMQNPLTTKGDLIVADVSGDATRFPAGSDGQVLTYDSSQTLGVKASSVATGSNAAPLPTAITAASGTSEEWARADHVHAGFKTLASGLPANWVDVPVEKMTDNVIAVGSSVDNNNVTPTKAASYFNVWPLAFSQDLTAYIGNRVVTQGSADANVYIGIWNAAADTGPGTLFASHTISGTVTGYQWSASTYNFQKNTLYWGAVFTNNSTTTTPVLQGGRLPNPSRVVRATSARNWGNNFPELNITWRMDATSLTDLTSTRIFTGDQYAGNQLSQILFKIA